MSILDKLPSDEDARDLVVRARESRIGLSRVIEIYTILVEVNAHTLRRGMPIPMTDLYQEGFIGLLRAIKTYDPVAFNAKFTTWAICCIQGAIRNFLRGEKKHHDKRNIIPITEMIADESSTLNEPAAHEIKTREETLSMVTSRLDISPLLTPRERDLMKARYNLEV